MNVCQVSGCAKADYAALFEGRPSGAARADIPRVSATADYLDGQQARMQAQVGDVLPRRRAIIGAHLVRTSARFKNGVLVEREGAAA